MGGKQDLSRRDHHSGPRGPRGGPLNWGSGFLPTTYQGVPLRGKGDPIMLDYRLAKQADGNWRISMRMKRFTTGGDGEAIRLFHRSAERIVRENKHAGYRVPQYSEGIESSVPLAQRYSEGTIRVIAAAP